jgi:arylsulfatase A-like enzyme
VALGHDPSAGSRGYKTDLYEGGHRVPFIVRWPGRAPAGGRSDAILCQADLLATCADLLGVSLPADAGEDSVSMLPLLRGAKNGIRDACIMHSSEGQFAIRRGRWKLLLWPGSGGWSPPTPAPSVWLDAPKADLSQLPPFQLYDLEADPAETTNVVAARPEIVEALGTLLRSQIDSGRSTPGAAQPVDLSGWPQVSWREQFAP